MQVSPIRFPVVWPIAFAILGLGFTSCSRDEESHSDAPKQQLIRPNIVLIVVDDAGYADFGFTGSQDFETDAIDSIASNGIRFTAAYCSASVCGPTRAGLLTGRYQQRFGHEFNIPPRFSEVNGLPVEVPTLADALRKEGYRTVAVGKWDLGFAEKFHPNQRGFDEFFGFLQGSRSYFPTETTRLDQLMHNQQPHPEDFDYLTDELGRRAVSYIESSQEKPFFLYLSFSAVHKPMQALESDLKEFAHIQSSQRRKLAAMTMALDRAVGNVLDALKRSGSFDNTLLIFVNDNGGPKNTSSRNTPFRGQKGSTFEGGIRVPMLMQWPSRFAGELRYDNPISTLDVFPTCMAAAGSDGAEFQLDGIDLLTVLEKPSVEAPHPTLYWRRGDTLAIRQGQWKLVKFWNTKPMLFDLSEDPGEAEDLASDYPDRVRQLLREHTIWAASLEEPRWTANDSN